MTEKGSDTLLAEVADFGVIRLRLRDELERLREEDFRCDQETEAVDEPGKQHPPRPAPR